MGTITLNKNNRLFWLGRYAERLCQGVSKVRTIQDELLDGDPATAQALCANLGLSVVYDTAEEACNHYCFDRALPESLLSAADAMIGNGMVLRELLGTPTLSYLQMAVTALETAATHGNSCAIELQWVIDDIMAFRGSYNDAIDSEEIRNIIKSGASVERLSGLIRFGQTEEAVLRKEVMRLLNRLYKTHLAHQDAQLARIQAFAFGEEEQPGSYALLQCVEGLFVI